MQHGPIGRKLRDGWQALDPTTPGVHERLASAYRADQPSQALSCRALRSSRTYLACRTRSLFPRKGASVRRGRGLLLVVQRANLTRREGRLLHHGKAVVRARLTQAVAARGMKMTLEGRLFRFRPLGFGDRDRGSRGERMVGRPILGRWALEPGLFGGRPCDLSGCAQSADPSVSFAHGVSRLFRVS